MSAKVSGAVAARLAHRALHAARRGPALLAGYALKALLEKARRQGLRRGEARHRERPHVIAKHASAPLSSLLYALGKQSDNFYAEMIFKTLGGEGKGRPAQERRRRRGGDAVAPAVPVPRRRVRP